jgi:hypothetical protein
MRWWWSSLESRACIIGDVSPNHRCRRAIPYTLANGLLNHELRRPNISGRRGCLGGPGAPLVVVPHPVHTLPRRLVERRVPRTQSQTSQRQTTR